MEEYVSRDKIKAWKVYSNERHEYIVPISSINLVPAVDVSPTVYGKWIFDDPLRGDFMCSKCLERQIVCSRYCPNCGAKMKENKG